MGEAVCLTGVSATLTARHVDPMGLEGEHWHTWTVKAWWSAEPPRDGRVLQSLLKGVLAGWQGTTMPAELWSGEAMARALMGLMDGCVGVEIDRPEGFHASVRAW